jgi:hypothetical protein
MISYVNDSETKQKRFDIDSLGETKRKRFGSSWMFLFRNENICFRTGVSVSKKKFNLVSDISIMKQTLDFVQVFQSLH